MKKENAIRYYRKFSGADGYIIGFTYKKKNYMIKIDGELKPRFFKMGRESTGNGGEEKLDLYLNNALKEQLIRKGAFEIDYKHTKGNKGRAFEKWVQNYYGQTMRDWDNIGFWKCGDINLDGIEYQIKFQGAQFVVVSTLHHLQKCGDDWKNYVPKRGRKKKVA